MKVAFPVMGNLAAGLKGLFNRLEIPYVEPKPITRKTLELGTRYSPEAACFPFKVNLGNFCEALEAGADMLLFAGGHGPCRFGYYGQTQVEILRQLGYQFDYLIVEMTKGHQDQLVKGLRKLSGGKGLVELVKAIHFGYQKIAVLDELEQVGLRVRPREIHRGDTSQVLKLARETVDGTTTYNELRKARHMALQHLARIPLARQRTVLKIALIGEIYTLLEPSINMNLEERLGHWHVEVVKSLYLSHWIKHHVFLDMVFKDHSRPYAKSAARLLDWEIGGHSRENLGKARQYLQHGCQGIIHVAPVTCMPEIVTKSLLPALTSPLRIPCQSLFLDEQSGEAGLETRLEAFVDMLHLQHAST